MQHEDAHLPRIGIVGGGFSGTMVLANLVAESPHPVAIDLFEASEEPAQGAAYGTHDTAHLLNVVAARMGAFAGKPEGFWEWLQTDTGQEERAKHCPHLSLAPDRFLPRLLYAGYLRHILQDAQLAAKRKHISVRIHHAEATHVEVSDGPLGPLIIGYEANAGHQHIPVDVLVLATGNLPPQTLAYEPKDDPRYIQDVLIAAQRNLFPQGAESLSQEETIAIIGTGLTTVDTILSLVRQGYPGTIVAISPTGLLPTPHAASSPYPPWEWTQHPDTVPPVLTRRVKHLRQEIAKAARDGYDWRSVIDSLRPVTQTLWKQMPDPEKRRFLRKLATFWSIHRHRVAPEIAQDLDALREAGRLRIIPGRITAITPQTKGLDVAVNVRGAVHAEALRAALVINCTGPAGNIAAAHHPLLQHLLTHGLIRPHAVKIGIEATSDYRAAGAAPDSIFVLGPLLAGECYESTAVPELREQAYGVARSVLKRIDALRGVLTNRAILSPGNAQSDTRA